MAKNPLLELKELGQSVWLDSIQRGQIRSGELRRLINEDGLAGETANPTLFDKAISHSQDYDDTIRDLAARGQSPLEIYEALAIEDVQMAADAFRLVYDQMNGSDGFVSIEVSPKLAYDTQGTIQEVKRFHQKLQRPNVMIKIPGTPEGLPAIEECLYQGININITLLFSLRAYEEVAQRYIRALQRRVSEGEPIHSIASVASFFVSRIDTLADQQIAEKLKTTSDPILQSKLESLQGRVAIANAEIAYQRFKALFGAPSFQQLQEQRARVQRPLWASTSTKNPNYSDVMYVEALIAPDTVDTMPLETLNAFRDHGHARLSMADDLDNAQRVLDTLSEVGLSLDKITDQVLGEGVEKFSASLDALLKSIESKSHVLVTHR